MSTASHWTNPSYDYRGAHVLVTGGTSGIGGAIARAYATAGADVTITGTRALASDYDTNLRDFRYLSLDVRDNDAIDAVASALDGLDILVNNAGANSPGGRSEYEPDVFEESVRINLTSAYRMAHACKRHLVASRLAGGASVIGIASMTSFFGNEWVPGYGAAKAGIAQLTKTLAIAWAGDRIRVNAVAAGLIATQMTKAMLADAGLTATFLGRTPLARVGTPRDIAGAVLFLTSAAAEYITGQTLPVDGGFSIRG
jgi:NAD(P)-dependent dehydrogenase (short-subunit alcohol dehydrogenase family)